MIRNSILAIILLFLVGCTQPRIEYVTKYQEVLVPVKTQIERPNRPVYEADDSTPSYTSKVLRYVELLEFKIDRHNGTINENNK